MLDSLGFVLIVGAVWLTIGLVLSIDMGRRGHNGFSWLIIGTLLGPIGLVLAIDARRHDERLDPAPIPITAAVRAVAGPVDVLVGYEGSPESAAAVEAAVALLGERVGRLTVATVVSYDDVRDEERRAREALADLAARLSEVTPELEILHGHPSSALTQFAVEGGYDLIVVGTRGKGISKAFLGSAATELARDSKIPVLLVGGGHQAWAQSADVA